LNSNTKKTYFSIKTGFGNPALAHLEDPGKGLGGYPHQRRRAV
jgi:hypothetical protein